MRRVLSIALVFVCGAFIAVAQPKSCKDCITWSADRSLKWSDFKGQADASSSNKAVTNSGMSITMNCVNGEADVVIGCFFNPAKSWTKTKDSDRLLAHEQLHFDITELFARKLRKEISQLGTGCAERYKPSVELYDRFDSACNEFQAQYDKETRHSILEEEQLRWEKLVAEELKSLEEFRSGR
jgi:hypothetical protein